jgi:hypothetical protein
MSEGCTATYRVWIVAECERLKQAVAYQPRCGKWSCPHCASLNKDEWSEIAIYGVCNLAPTLSEPQFVTITSRGYVTPARSLVIFKTAWPKLIRRIRYAQDEKPEYLLVPEHHKSGVLHAHILITANHSQHWWHDQAFASGMGFKAHTEPIYDPVLAGQYIHKELTKQMAGKSWPANFRRVRKSENWPLPKEQDRTGWEYEVFKKEGDKNWQVHLLRDLGYEVYEAET